MFSTSPPTRTVVVMLIFLSIFFAPQLGFSSYTLPDPDKTTAYINNLIDSYNALVNSNDRYRPDFESIKVYFKLYHDVGHTFRVIVAQALPDTPEMTEGIENATDFLNLGFIPIVGDRPDIKMEYNKTASEIVGFGGLTGEGNLREDTRIEYEGGITYLALVFSILKDDISGNYMANSKNAAKLIYEADRDRIPTVSQTQIQTNQNPQPSSFVIEMIVTVVGGIIAIVAGDMIYDSIKKKRARKDRKESKEARRAEKLRKKLLGQKDQRVKQPNTTEDKKTTQGKKLNP